MIRIIFLGPPGSGKGTQAHLIADLYNIPNISSGEILRHSYNTFKLNLPSTNAINLINSGKLVNDELIIKLIINRIRKTDCQHGFIIDGFPRTINQAIAIKKNKISIDFVIEFYMKDAEIIDRIIGRQIHLSSGRIYHKKYNPPKFHGIDDITGENLIVRKDDTEEVIQQRLDQYYKYTAPLSNYYKKQAKKNNMHFYVINSNQEIMKIHTELVDIINLYAST
ncbi:adenylate kinase [Candidatus Blochmanniella vafra str. BVAF]|uniref:Adenylate kinase n=1 Tax=Blochmanniella vafra (strain BVAF) TaxID=859654 RepID=E8Q6V6_BLOVB|nr:nucleoside monophosphate kinase [Candidatus Blochmannia vafer]ADV33703.1 adenylate kinase [Candidatus Blochmannia vafer str. BVAF]